MPLSRTDKHPLPQSLFRAEQVRELDRLAIDEYRIPGYELMKRAGESAFDVLRDAWPRAHRIVVLCGAGNNAGDGYVLARCALEQGFDVCVMAFKPVGKLKGDALAAAEDYQKHNGKLIPFEVYQLDSSDVIVDALLGTGLEREVEGELFSVIEAANNSVVPKLALDIPSGLHADTGNIMGAAIEADITVSFIGVKQGMFTASGADCCGQIVYDDLQVPSEVFMHVAPAVTRISHSLLDRLLWKRPPSSHKGDNGHILIIGGDYGMMGAVGLAGEAALRVGAGM
ncbi:MAG: NAD(P)H-hydrate epimerase, partial [Gammaproteobacteria bacterium]|nr:NAD(P)H-hydrate epimerase [Gammaproteobacteria bacterium]